METLPYEVNEEPQLEAGDHVERLAKTNSLTWNGEKLPETPSPGWGPPSPMSQQENPKGSKQGQAESSKEIAKEIFPPTPKDYGLGFFVGYKQDWAREFLAKVKGSGMDKAMEHCIVYGKAGKEFLFSPRGLVGNPDKDDFPIRVIFKPHASQRNFQTTGETVPPSEAEMDKIAEDIKEKLLPMLATEEKAEVKPSASAQRGEGILRVPAPPVQKDPDSPDVIVTSETGEIESPHERSGAFFPDGQPYEFFEDSQPDEGEPCATLSSPPSPIPATAPSGGSCQVGGKQDEVLGEEEEQEKKPSDSDLAYPDHIVAAGVKKKKKKCAKNFKIPKIYSEGVDGAVVLSSSFGDSPKSDVADENGKAVPSNQATTTEATGVSRGSTLDPKSEEKHEPSTATSPMPPCPKPSEEKELQPLPTLPKEITGLDFIAPSEQVKPKAKAKAKGKAKAKAKGRSKTSKSASAPPGRGRGRARGRGGRGRGRASCRDVEDGNEEDGNEEGESEGESVADKSVSEGSVPAPLPEEAKRPKRPRVSKAKKTEEEGPGAPPPAKKKKVPEPGEKEDPPKTRKTRKPKVETDAVKSKRKTKEVPQTEAKKGDEEENEAKPKRKRKSDPSNMSPEEVELKAKRSRKSSAYHVTYKKNLEHGEDIARQRAKEVTWLGP